MAKCLVILIDYSSFGEFPRTMRAHIHLCVYVLAPVFMGQANGV